MKNFSNSFLLLFLFTLIAHAAEDCESLLLDNEKLAIAEEALPIQRYKYFANIYGGKLYDDYFNQKWLENLVKKNPSLDQFLSALPPSIRRSHTLSIGSKSTQYGSSSKPRAILSNSDSTFLLTFSGDPNQRGYSSLEVVIYDNLKFEFVPFEIYIGKNNNLIGPKKNPRKCIACHGKVFRPIWNAYSFWPRFYGSSNNFSSTFGHSLLKAEQSAFDDFILHERRLGRYRYLLGNETLPQIEAFNSALTLNLAHLNVLRVKKLITTLTDSQPNLKSLIRFVIEDLATDKPPRDLLPILNPKESKLYTSKIKSIQSDIRFLLDLKHKTDIKEHMKAVNFNSSIFEFENIWSPEVGVWHHDANVVFHKYRSSDENINMIEIYTFKLANLKFVIEILGGSSLAEWSMSTANKPGGLPFYSTPLKSAWNFLLDELN
ncbi:MAG: hypothetical protein H6625_08585 [Bdellovibrionaceae bacterium]|nr:hypothetical protein [Pseudobdellovibrionaceae bacterium]